jgi:hypothetical protein
MRGSDEHTEALFSYVDVESRIRSDHPLRRIREITNAALAALDEDFGALYARRFGRPSIPPERLLRAMLLQVFYGIRSERQLPGRVQAVRTAEVRARVDGIVERRLYEEDTDVATGRPLFRIDPRQNQAAYNGALASLNRARAVATNAVQVVHRYAPLVREQAISSQEYEAASAQADADAAARGDATTLR